MNACIRKFAIIALSLIFICLAVIISSCCKECPTEPEPPKPYKGWLYASDWWYNRAYQIDIETDSVVDSVSLSQVGHMAVSQDGKYLSICDQAFRKTYIYDAQSMAQLQQLDSVGFCIFISNENLFVMFDQNIVRHYLLPDFSLIYESEIGNTFYPYLIEDTSLIFCYSDSDTLDPDSGMIIAYDYEKGEVVDSWYLKDSFGSWFGLLSLIVHPDADKVYFIGYARRETYGLFLLDLETGEIRLIKEMYTDYGDLTISPDGMELYATDPGIEDWRLNPGTVYILDANNGKYLHGISLYGYSFYPDWPLHARPLAFTPTGEKVYVGAGYFQQGAIVVIDPQIREITKLIWPELGHYMRQLVIGPKI